MTGNVTQSLTTATGPKETAGEIITRLYGKFEKIAWRNIGDEIEFDDLLQNICLVIMEMINKRFDGSFPTGNDLYILRCAINAAQKYGRKHRTYRKYTVASADIRKYDHDGLLLEFWATVSDRRPLPEQFVDVHEIIEFINQRFEGTNLKIITMLIDGFLPVEIAQIMGVSKTAISYSLNTIRFELQNRFGYYPAQKEIIVKTIRLSENQANKLRRDIVSAFFEPAMKSAAPVRSYILKISKTDWGKMLKKMKKGGRKAKPATEKVYVLSASKHKREWAALLGR